MELPTSPKRCLAIVMLRVVGLKQKEAASIAKCANQIVVDVEKWFKKEDYHRVARICDDQSIKKMVAAEAIYWGVEEETLVKLDRLTQDDILRHYRTDYMEVTEMTTLPEKYLIDHYGKLHEVLEQCYDQLRIPELSELCLFTLKDRVTISRSYVSEMYAPAVTYEKGVIKLDVEASDPLWECLEKHLSAEFPAFSENLGDWKKDITTIVEGCHDITKTITSQLAKTSWVSAEPYLDPASEKYGPGVFYHILTDLIYKCLMADHVPEFPPRVSDSHGLSILVMDYSTGRTGIARGECALLDQVQQHCVDIASDDTTKKKVRKVLDIVEQLESKQEPIKKRLRVVLERGTFKGTCLICSDLVAKSG